MEKKVGFLSETMSWIKRHKLISVAAVLVLAGGVWWFFFRTTAGITTAVQYVTGQPSKKTIIASVTGTGQVLASSQVALKPKASGDLVLLKVKDGQSVKAGDVIAQIDTTNALKSIRDAQSSLASAQLSLKKIQEPVDSLTVLQSQNSLAQATQAKLDAQNALKTAYDNGFNEVASTFIDLPNIVTGLNNILYGTDVNPGSGQQNLSYYADAAARYEGSTTGQSLLYKNDADTKYRTARSEYDVNLSQYKITDRSADTGTIESLISESYTTTQDVADALKSATNMIRYYQDKMTARELSPVTVSNTQITNLASYMTSVNAHVSKLLSATTAISTAKNNITQSERTVAEQTASLAKVKAGTDPLDIESAKLTVQQREQALSDARQALSDYVVTAPFDGIIAGLSVKKGDTVSSGTSIATLLTNQKIVEITLNEVDVAKVKVGQKVTLDFDALPDLQITGSVLEIDPLGTVSQGVVTYSVKVGFDVLNPSILSGMSVNAAVVTGVASDVLALPTSAVKTDQSGGSYVEVMDANATTPRRVTVTTGLSDDSSIEIKTGISETDAVVTRTVTPTTSTTGTSSTPSLLGGGGVRLR